MQYVSNEGVHHACMRRMCCACMYAQCEKLPPIAYSACHYEKSRKVNQPPGCGVDCAILHTVCKYLRRSNAYKSISSTMVRASKTTVELNLQLPRASHATTIIVFIKSKSLCPLKPIHTSDQNITNLLAPGSDHIPKEDPLSQMALVHNINSS